MTAAAKRDPEPFRLFEEGLRFLFDSHCAQTQQRFLEVKEIARSNLELQARIDQTLRVCDRKINPAGPFAPVSAAEFD